MGSNQLVIRCGECRTKYDVSRHDPGTRIRCQKCESVLEVPASGGTSEGTSKKKGTRKRSAQKGTGSEKVGRGTSKSEKNKKSGRKKPVQTDGVESDSSTPRRKRRRIATDDSPMVELEPKNASESPRTSRRKKNEVTKRKSDREASSNERGSKPKTVSVGRTSRRSKNVVEAEAPVRSGGKTQRSVTRRMTPQTTRQRAVTRRTTREGRTVRESGEGRSPASSGMTGIVVGGVFVLGIVLLGLALWKSGGDGNGTAVKIATFEEQLSERLGQASGQVKMLLDVADWCRSQKKTDRENEVLGKILEIDSDHTAARSRLGFRQLDGSWVDDETFRQMEKDRAVFQEALGDEVLTLRTKHFLLGTSSAQEAAGSEWLKKVGDRFEEVLTTYYSRWKRDFSSELKIRKLSAIPRRTIVIYPDAASYKKHAIGIEKSYGNTVAFVEADSKVLYTLKYGDFLALPPVHDMLLNTLYFEWDKKERNHVFSLRGLEGLRLVGFDSTLYRSEHFLVAIQNSKGYSSIAALENYTQILEELYVEFYKIVGASISIEPVTVEMPMFIFKNKTEYVNYGKKTGKGNLLGMAEGHYEPKYRRMMTFKADVEDRKSTVLHEGTHLLFHHVARFNHSKMLWFNEGVADYFSGYRLEKGRLVLGFPPNRKRASHLKQLVAMSLRRKKAPPIKSILAYSYLQRNILLGSGKPQQRILQEMQQVYIYSWGLVHFFMHGENEKYRKRFLEYMSDELKGKSGPAAFQTRFSGVDLKTLTQEFIVHVRNLK